MTRPKYSAFQNLGRELGIMVGRLSDKELAGKISHALNLPQPVDLQGARVTVQSVSSGRAMDVVVLDGDRWIWTAHGVACDLDVVKHVLEQALARVRAAVAQGAEDRAERLGRAA